MPDAPRAGLRRVRRVARLKRRFSLAGGQAPEPGAHVEIVGSGHQAYLWVGRDAPDGRAVEFYGTIDLRRIINHVVTAYEEDENHEA